jgi:flavin-dependent dehydrogenase
VSERLPALGGVRAVVIGGSIAGLLAARALCRHCEQVVLLDRDRFPACASPRPGVPQSRHVHQLLLRGLLILEAFFPGLRGELVAAGATMLELPQDVATFAGSGWGPRFHSGLETLCCSRELLEHHVRSRLWVEPCLLPRESTTAIDLALGAGGERVVGVRWRRSGGEEGVESADLVVDASGSRSHAAGWVEAAGYGRVTELRIDAAVGYASRLYRRPPSAPCGWKALFVSSVPPLLRRGGGVFPIEGQRWLVTLSGAGADYPPTREDGFLAFAHSLADPTLYEAIRDAEPLSPIWGYRSTANRWQRFDRLPRLPAGLAVLGDAVCTFNPVYGQGMTVAALGAELLADLLQRHSPVDGAFGRRFQRALARRCWAPWFLATAQDRLFRETRGQGPGAWTGFAERYLTGALHLAFQKPRLYLDFLRVANLVAPVASLAGPRLLPRVLGRMLARPSAGEVESR